MGKALPTGCGQTEKPGGTPKSVRNAKCIVNLAEEGTGKVYPTHWLGSVRFAGDGALQCSGANPRGGALPKIALVVPILVGLGSGACATMAPPLTRSPVDFTLVHSAAECRRIVSKPDLCGDADTEQSQMEIAPVDVDGDGAKDLIIRRQSSLTCGSHGCSTDVYFQRGETYVRGDPPLVTAGPLYLCRSTAGAGIEASTGSGRGPCIIIK